MILLLSMSVFLLSVGCSSSKKSDDKTSEKTSSDERSSRRPPGGADPAELFAKLNLNEEQEEKYNQIMEKYHEKRRELFESGKGDRSAGMKKMQQLEAEEEAEVKSILTSAQFELYQAEKKKMRENMPSPSRGGPPSRGSGS